MKYQNMFIQTAKSTYAANEPDNTYVLANHPCKARKNMGVDLFLQPVFFYISYCQILLTKIYIARLQPLIGRLWH